ncbi:lytic polysaccharide monooxygenase [Kitasatospora sp. NPDC002040]|uniref:lytic polysaccharide monooxygenase auxiliary activity family 9 protein n=1 Tax=Kitasatospora sp. NPDC002040 TaxID=3154661 RepID=UPI003333D79E
MSIRRTAVVVALAGTALATTALGAGTATAHGSLQNPLSRVYGCYLEGPEQPKSAACKAAIAYGGTQAMYDWNGVRIGDAAGRHRQLIPDGRLCSANAAEFVGLDLPRTDWPATNLTAGASTTFKFRATAPHRGTFQLFLTNSSYNPSLPLSWSNLDTTPFASITDPVVVNGYYSFPVTIPTGKTGRQMIYAIWQRSDSPEAFYTCSDVAFDGSGTAAAPAAVVAASDTTEHHDHAAAPALAPAAAPAAAVPAVAPAAAAPAAAAPAGTTQELAQTGTDRSTGLMAAVGSSFILAGGAVAVMHRRRRTAGLHAR